MSDKPKIEEPETWRTADELDAARKLILQTGQVWIDSEHPPSPEYLATLGLSDEAISPKRSKRGSKGINPRQRDILCWGASALEKVYQRKNLSFLTLTLPDMSPDDLLAIKSNWSDIVHRVQLRIKEKLHGMGIETALTGCVELQLERFENSGVLYPHLHLVFRGRRDSGSDWAIKPHQFRQIWRRCCGKFLRSEKYDWGASENVQQVKKSVAGYLAKYVSKCASKSGEGMLSSWHPKDWIFIGRRIRALYESLTLSGQYVSEMLDKVVRSWEPGLGYVNSVFIQSAAFGERRIGYSGWLSREVFYPDYQELHPFTIAQ